MLGWKEIFFGSLIESYIDLWLGIFVGCDFYFINIKG